MGVYIKGMEMPENCDSCFCYYNPTDSWEKLCSVSQLEWYMSDKKPDWCPLVPVPDHGRLVDADNISTVMLKERNRIAETYGENDEYVRCLEKYAISIVAESPTVIPADPKEDSNA